MPHFHGQHEPTDINEAVVLTAAQMNELMAFLTDLLDKRDAPPAAALSDAQFAELREMLKPGAELSKLYLSQMNAARGAPGTPANLNPGGPGTPVLQPAVPPKTDQQVAAEQEAADRDRTPFRLDDRQERLDSPNLPRSPDESDADYNARNEANLARLRAENPVSTDNA